MIATLSRPLAAALLAAASLFCAADGAVQFVPQPLDLTRYAGVWYEIARLPDDGRDHCAGDVTVNYAVRKDGRMAVSRRCRVADGGFATRRGVARGQKDDPTGTRLEVNFSPRWLHWLPLGWHDHWVVAIDAGYDFAVVTDRDRRGLWLMSRTPRVDAARLDALLASLRAQGHPVDRLVRTPHASLLPPRVLRVMT